MLVTSRKLVSNARPNGLMAGVGALSFILLATAGLLALSSCASTPQGVQREEALYLTASNAIATGHTIAPYLPAPANSVVEGLLAVGGALLAVWASHLHRSVRNLENGGTPPAPPAPPGPG